MIRTLATLAAGIIALSTATASFAAGDKMTEKPSVTPGTEATKSMGGEVPDMKAKCAENDDTARTAATETMSKQVPTMTAKADCDEAAGEKEIKTN